MAPARPHRILVVDDHDTHRRVLALTLRPPEFDVTGVRDGLEALAYLRDHVPDAILLDVHMPGMSGLEVGLAVRRLEGLATVPILVMSSELDETIRSRAAAFHAADVLAKPIPAPQLRRRLTELIG
jgi:CheY-like chemotaxis protein